MHTLTWQHTRKKTPMTLRGNFSAVMFRVWMVRHVHPHHPMQLDGQAV